MSKDDERRDQDSMLDEDDFRDGVRGKYAERYSRDEVERVIEAPPPREVPPLPPGIKRRKPRDYVEWKTLREWGKLPSWDELPASYLLREARENAGLTQAELAERLGCSQQAVARAERWESNPTVAFMRRWARALRADLHLELEPYR